jgi:crotonobetainyl-CoA:carnitine CoA-transferase CaiB-like acyl-CoA transferase
MYSVPGAPIQPHGRGAGRIPAINEDASEVEKILAGRRRRTASESARTCGFPLHDVRVIEIGMNTVAPLAGRQLGALGADVIKIEPPRGDVNRANAPLREDGESFIFSVSNTDKRGIVLDLSRPEDADTLWKLLATADVVLENLKPGSLERLGFSAEAVRSRCPEIVYCSMSGFGHDSAYAGRPALDTVIQAMSGVMASNRQDSMPTKAGISIADQLGGQFGLLAVLSALHQRDRTGRGTHVDIAMQDVTAWSTQYLWNETTTDLPPVEVLESADGFVLVEGLDTQDIAKRLHTDDVDAARSLGKHLSRNEILDRLNTEAIPVAAPVCTLDEVLTSQQTIDRQLVISRPSNDGDTWTVLESPMRLSKTPARVRTAMARLGALDVSLHDELVHLSATQAAARQTGADHAG